MKILALHKGRAALPRRPKLKQRPLGRGAHSTAWLAEWRKAYFPGSLPKTFTLERGTATLR